LLLPSGSVPYQIAAGTRCFPAGRDEFSGRVIIDDPAAATTTERNHSTAVRSFFYGRRLPFETLLNPKQFITPKTPLVDYHINPTFAQKVTASISDDASAPDDTPFRSAMGNFLGSVPDFFLENEGVTMVVGKPEDPQNITVLSGAMYVGEVVLRQTPNFNIYSNPQANGPATATGSIGWDALDTFVKTVASKHNAHTPLKGPDGVTRHDQWPKHHGEFAPHTAPYYYGPSVARFTYIAPGVDAEGNALRADEATSVTLKQIIQGCKIDFLNEDSWKYDCDHSGTVVIPPYGWNRAWANRMNLDATLVLDNRHAGIEPQNSWAIGTRWESPVLDFPNTSWHDDEGSNEVGHPFAERPQGSYNFSSSIKNGEFNRVDRNLSAAPHTYGMWHQYGILPFEGEGVFMELNNVDPDEQQLIRRIISNGFERNVKDSVDDTRSTGSLSIASNHFEYRFSVDENNRTSIAKFGGIVSNNHSIANLLSIDRFRVDGSGSIYNQSVRLIDKINPVEKSRIKHLKGSLWTLTGFKQEDIGKRFQIGKVATSKTISEAIVAIPFINTDGEEFEFITIPPPRQGENEGPQVAKLREKLALYNLPPALERNLSVLIPKEFPIIPDGFDFSQPRLNTEKRPFAIYLFEFNMELNQQDITDIWNNVMPRASVKTLAEETSGTVFSVDHAIPCSDFTAESIGRIDRRLRDLIDIQNPEILGAPPGLDDRVRWMVFKVKRRSVQSYEEMIQNSLLNAGAIDESEAPVLRGPKAYAKRDRNFNWPYDFFSMIEMAKVTTGVQFRPDVSEIDVGGDFKVKQPEIGGGGREED